MGILLSPELARARLGAAKSYRCAMAAAAPWLQQESAMSRMEEERHDAPKTSAGNTVTQQGENQVPKARMPHERDESTDSQAPEAPSNQRMGQLAHDDAASGQPDTDKGPALDAAYEKQKDAPKQRRQ
jgi:hypothetical protein